jgi:hypothetical protein
MSRSWPWVPLILLGAYHGLNPGMGWLFALARGLQEKKRAALVQSLLPIALGHAIAIALALLILQIAQTVFPLRAVKIAVATILFGVGLYRIIRARHPRGAGMRAGWWELSFWSLLMASSHGAGLMLIPVLLAHPGHPMSHHMAVPIAPDTLSVHPSSFLVMAVLVHTASLLVVAGALAILFYQAYDRYGLSMLQKAWFNFDLLWALALFVAAAAALFI